MGLVGHELGTAIGCGWQVRDGEVRWWGKARFVSRAIPSSEEKLSMEADVYMCWKKNVRGCASLVRVNLAIALCIVQRGACGHMSACGPFQSPTRCYCIIAIVVPLSFLPRVVRKLMIYD